MTMKPPIFLSSVFRERDKNLELRKRVMDITGGGPRVPRIKPRPIWMAEDFRGKLHQEHSSLTPLEMAEFCVEGVREADCFVAVPTERWGSEIHVDGIGDVPTSFFEIELMEAALLEKPSFIFLHKDFTPSAQLANLLELLRPAFPNMALERLSEDQILHRIERLVKHVENPVLRRFPLHVPRRRLFVDTLFRLRHRPYRVKDEPPPIRFLDGFIDSEIKPTRASLVEPLLVRARNEPNYQNRLTILWFALRALMGVPYTDPACTAFVPLWEDTLGAWNSAGAWYGLHGHAAMGCLAALGSLAEARATIAPTSDAQHGIPHGPIASAYYSIAKNAGRSDEIYRLALEHIETTLALGAKNATNLLAIRGSIQLRLGQTAAAIADYEQVARGRESFGDGTYGEALSELGHALVISGRKREGLAQLERGFELLKKNPRRGFEIRAMRKLAVGHARSLNFRKALDYAVMAYDTAIASGAYDQISRLERLAKKLEWLRRR